MISTELTGILLMFAITLLLAVPFGRYIARVFQGERTFADRLFRPLERRIFKWSGIDPDREMSWQEQLKALLVINLIWFVWTMCVLMNQHLLPLNPDHIKGMSPDLAFNTAISFVANCNLQHYSGETGVSYFSQIFGLMFLQFVSAGTGIAAVVVLFKAMKARSGNMLGNFYRHFLLSCTRILLPVSLVIAALLLWRGTPMTFDGKQEMTTLEGHKVEVATGPVAAFVPIKHAGTNGGGFFGANSAHPFENPDYFTNSIEMIAQMLIPFALIFAWGKYSGNKRFSRMVFGVMTIGFCLLVIPAIYAESQGNPALKATGIDTSAGNMEGKETRFGTASSAYWSIATTVISTGSVNAMHDSFMPLSQTSQLLAMMTNAFYGGCGVGILNFYVFIILAVFIGGLMVGRTPEFFGKKIEAGEMKIAVIIALLHPLLLLTGTALALANPHFSSEAIHNAGPHGFSEMLYEYTSSAANNGSGLEGLSDNTPWWNISTGIVILLGRFLPIIGPLAIAGKLAAKSQVPESTGTLRTDSSTFGLIVFAVIFILTALSFFPALALGPIAEHVTLF